MMNDDILWADAIFSMCGKYNLELFGKEKI
jgi:hypothetical protein